MPQLLPMPPETFSISKQKLKKFYHIKVNGTSLFIIFGEKAFFFKSYIISENILTMWQAFLFLPVFLVIHNYYNKKVFSIHVKQNRWECLHSQTRMLEQRIISIAFFFSFTASYFPCLIAYVGWLCWKHEKLFLFQRCLSNIQKNVVTCLLIFIKNTTKLIFTLFSALYIIRRLNRITTQKIFTFSD